MIPIGFWKPIYLSNSFTASSQIKFSATRQDSVPAEFCIIYATARKLVVLPAGRLAQQPDGRSSHKIPCLPRQLFAQPAHAIVGIELPDTEAQNAAL